jgi:hypothetical protein
MATIIADRLPVAATVNAMKVENNVCRWPRCGRGRVPRRTSDGWRAAPGGGRIAARPLAADRSSAHAPAPVERARQGPRCHGEAAGRPDSPPCRRHVPLPIGGAPVPRHHHAPGILAVVAAVRGSSITFDASASVSVFSSAAQSAPFFGSRLVT